MFKAIFNGAKKLAAKFTRTETPARAEEPARIQEKSLWDDPVALLRHHMRRVRGLYRARWFATVGAGSKTLLRERRMGRRALWRIRREDARGEL